MELNNDNKVSKLDEKYRKISYCLSIDARIPKAKLAKLAGIRPGNLKYRIDNLIKKDYFHNIALINDTKLGLISAMICIKLKKVHKRDYESLFLKFPQLRRYKESSGLYDLLFWIDILDLSHLQRILERLSQFLGTDLENYDVLFIEEEDALGLKMLTKEYGSLRTYFEPSYGGAKQAKYQLNRYELRIINAVRSKPMINIAALASEINASINTTKKYFAKLQKNNVIRRITISPNLDKYGFLSYNLFVKINNAKREQFERHMQNAHEIWWRKKLIGRWDYDLSIAVKSNAEFINLITNLRNKLSDILLDSAFIMSKERKLSLRFRSSKSSLKKTIIMFCGIPYSGKTTMLGRLRGKLIENGLQGSVFSTTDYRLRDGKGVISLGFYDENNALSRNIRNKYVDELVEDAHTALLTGGSVVLLDSTFANAERRKKIFTMAKNYGYTIVLIYLKCNGNKEVQKRIEARSKIREYKSIPHDHTIKFLKERYVLQKDQFSPPTQEELQKHNVGFIEFDFKKKVFEEKLVTSKNKKIIREIISLLKS